MLEQLTNVASPSRWNLLGRPGVEANPHADRMTQATRASISCGCAANASEIHFSNHQSDLLSSRRMGRLRGVLSLLRIARATRAPFPFLWNQARRTAGIRRYRLRESGVFVHVRHGTPDLNTFEEVFLERQYEPPPTVEKALARGGLPLRVADLGANIGLFGAFAFGRLPIAWMVAFEPDPANARVHAATIAANGLRWDLVRAAAGPQARTVGLAGGKFALSHVAHRTGRTTDVPMVDVFDHLTDVDLIKIDIEGGEWPILEDARLPTLTATCIVAEYHPQTGIEDPPRHAASLLKRAGYRVWIRAHRVDGTGMLWAWREPPIP